MLPYVEHAASSIQKATDRQTYFNNMNICERNVKRYSTVASTIGMWQSCKTTQISMIVASTQPEYIGSNPQLKQYWHYIVINGTSAQPCEIYGVHLGSICEL